MAEQKGLGPVKRYGTRYGRTLKYKLAQIEIAQKNKQTCPTCLKQKVRRIAMGIYRCDKCNVSFAAGAYSVGKKVSLAEAAAMIATEAQETPEEES